ncbi:MAG: UDP-N-acetylmuramoyl-tripeptide--D-alanyl-D-alanine ligase [Bacteroides sp.]|nr:UDP-N-acetylmuramoyl-tripeptide--D-alanyl-D-alanine ligase [Bacteroides sp.]
MILSIVALTLCALALVAEFSRTLMLVQQNSYRIDRFRRSLAAMGDSTSFAKLFGIVFALAATIRGVPEVMALAGLGLFSLIMVILRLSARRKYKHPLVWTPRVRRIFGVMLLLVALIAVGVSFMPQGRWGWARVYAILAMFLWVKADWVAIAALWLLKPVEKSINQRYINDAKRILASMPDLTVIGITGSYGKTSTKHYLHRILSEQFAVCMTPGSFNTTLGVVRTIREYLKPFDRVFICEMGAKQPGDIKEICDLVHPSVGIITAVGPQHLESFKTIENVQATKFELIDSLPANGMAVLNNDFEYVANRPVGNVEAVRYAIEPSADTLFSVADIRYSATGTDFTVLTPDGELKLHTRLVGECNVSNLVAAVIVALRLGVDSRRIAYAVEQIEQVEHRLSVKRTAGGITILDDAFNSNPAGSAMALDVLASLPGRRFVITPGMIELGDRQEELNADFGRKIAASADVAIIVGRYNRDAIVGGIESAKNAALELHTVDTFAQAQALMLSQARPGDAVLYENDLPDTFK